MKNIIIKLKQMCIELQKYENKMQNETSNLTNVLLGAINKFESNNMNVKTFLNTLVEEVGYEIINMQMWTCTQEGQDIINK